MQCMSWFQHVKSHFQILCIYISIVTQLTSNGQPAFDALLSEQFAKAVSAIRFVFARCELLTREHLLAVGASEALAMPWGALVCDATLVDDLE